MQEFMVTVHQQMRLVSQFETVNQSVNMALVAATSVLALWLWSQGSASVGAVAASIAMALRLNGISHWIMWELAMLFEHIGTVRDGMGTLSRPHNILDVPNAPALKIQQGSITDAASGSTDSSTSPQNLCPKCGHPLRSTDKRCWKSGCGYVVSQPPPPLAEQ